MAVRGDVDGVLEPTVPVARLSGGSATGTVFRLGVEAPLELAEQHAEQEVAPGAWANARRLPAALGQLVPRRVDPVRDRARAARRRSARPADRTVRARRRQRQHGRDVRIHGAEQGAVLHVAARAPPDTSRRSRHRLAEQFDVVVATTEHELVERLLDRPDGRCDRAADGTPAAFAFDRCPCSTRRNCNGRDSPGTQCAMDHDDVASSGRASKGVNVRSSTGSSAPSSSRSSSSISA